MNGYIIFAFFLFIFSYLFLFSGYNPYRLIMIFGKKGSGKTSFIAKKSLYFQKRGYKVYSNIEIPGNYFFDPSTIGLDTFAPGSIVFLDEVSILYDNRKFKEFKDYTLIWFRYARQYRITMYMFSQAFDIDKKLRDLTDEIYLIKRCGKFSILRKVNKQVGIATDQNGNGTLVDAYKFGSIFSTKFIYLPRYYGLFKSFDPPALPLISATLQDYNDISRVYSNNKTWMIYRIKAFGHTLKVLSRNLYKILICKINNVIKNHIKKV